MEVIAGTLDSFPNTNTSTLIIGDLNIDDLVPSSSKGLFTELITSYNIRRIPLPPTRITPDSATSIDAVCTSLNDNQISVQVLHTGVSDHTGQLCRLDLPRASDKPTIAVRRHLNLNNLKELKRHLSLVSWDNVLQTNDIDQAYNNLLHSLTVALDLTCPETKSRNKRTNRIIQYDEETNDLKQSFLEANNLYLTKGSMEDKARANNLKKAYDLKLRSLRRKENADHIALSDNKSKAIWNIINQERKSKVTLDPEIKTLVVDDETIVDPMTMAQKFNEYFTTIAEKTLQLNQNIPPAAPCVPSNSYPQPKLSEFSVTSTAELSKIVDNMKIKNSSGLDGISSKIVKHCKEELLQPLLHITNLSIQLGGFPSRMKISKVFPLYKRGKKDSMGNYRPISLVPTFSKIIERIVLSRLLQFLDTNNLTTECQHGFRKGRSTITALVDLVENIIDNIENGNRAIGIFVDMSKAFDCLSHDVILRKLSSLGIRGKALQWFGSYLGERTQVVELGYTKNNEVIKVRSTPLPVSRGVPQGSVMGPIIFTLFTNDLPAHISPYGRCCMYADDTVILSANKSAENLEIKSYVAVNLALDYCSNNDLVFNQGKTKQLVFGARKEEISDLPGLQIEHFIKHLGVSIDDNLSWSIHIEDLCVKLSSAIFAIRRSMAIGTKETALVAYYALFDSKMRYGIALWGNSTRANLDRVLVLQKRAIRVMAGLEVRHSCRKTFQEWGIMTAVAAYIFEVIFSSCSRELTRNAQIHDHNTRFASNFNLPPHRRTFFEKKPSYAGARYFNILPAELKNLPPPRLKPHLKQWLTSRPFYSIGEFLSWKDFGTSNS